MLAQRTPPMSAAAKRSRRMGSAGCGGWAAVRSLRSVSGAAHSGAARVSVQMESAEGIGENSFVSRLANASFSGETKYS